MYLSAILNLQKMPVVLVCDDPCTYVSHSMQRYPTEAELAFGETRGCFEMPSNDIPPRTGIRCPDIIPIEVQLNCNRMAMNENDFLLHPDSSTTKRYVFGTR